MGRFLFRKKKTPKLSWKPLRATDEMWLTIWEGTSVGVSRTVALVATRGDFIDFYFDTNQYNRPKRKDAEEWADLQIEKRKEALCLS